MSGSLGSVLVCIFFLIPAILAIVAFVKRGSWKGIFGISRKYDFIPID
jgi:hypothetical protein